MNLRILKKLSKRAAPLLAALGDDREQFRAEREENYASTVINARKHWDRNGHVHPSNYTEEVRQGEFYFRTRRGSVVHISNHYVHPRKGTIMVGATEGYYEPEWAEETAWCAFKELVWQHFTEWDEDGPTPTRVIRTPSDYFKAAAEILPSNSQSAEQS